MVLKLVLEIKSRAKALDLISSTNLNTTAGSNYYVETHEDHVLKTAGIFS